MIIETIELPSAIFTRDDSGVVRIKFHDDYVIDYEDAVRHEKAVVDICAGIRRFFIIDGRLSSARFTPSAKAYLAKSDIVNGLKVAQALLVGSVATQVIAKLYLKLNKPDCISMIFTNENEALSWLDQSLIAV